MTKCQHNNASRVWEAFARLTIVSGGGGVNFATTRAIANEARCSGNTVLKYMNMARDAGACRREMITTNTPIWIREDN